MIIVIIIIIISIKMFREKNKSHIVPNKERKRESHENTIF